MMLFFSLGICLFTFYAYRKFYCQRVFKKLGILGPEPHWLFGNLLELWVNDRHLVIDDWAKRYGKVFGYYQGSTPVIMISDVEAVEQLCVRQFSDFQARILLPVQPDQEATAVHPFLNVGTLWGARWKRLRTILNPSFSTGKLKSYGPCISKRQGDLIAVFDDVAKSGDEMNVMADFENLTLDVIGEVAFGVELDCVKKTRQRENKLLSYFNAILTRLMSEPLVVRVGDTLPEIMPLTRWVFDMMVKLRVGPFAVVNKITDICTDIVRSRIANPKSQRPDILQNMIDNMSSDDGISLSDKENFAPLTLDEVKAQSLQILAAGFGTTSTTLSFASYLLAKNPKVQEKLAKEVTDAFGTINCLDDNLGNLDDGLKVDYDALMSLPYLDWAVRETLRLYPVGIYVVNRLALPRATEFMGIPIQKGMLVHVNTWGIHRDPEIWGPHDVDEFCPERFAPEYNDSRPEAAFLGFGLGPRHCIGMRLALFEIKLTLVNILRRFRILPVLDEDGNVKSLPLQVTRLMLPLGRVVNVRLEHRVAV